MSLIVENYDMSSFATLFLLVGLVAYLLGYSRSLTSTPDSSCTEFLMNQNICSRFDKFMRDSKFDCGSGIGVVRSEETVNLNEWNRLVLYRHRWDAWIQLNNGKHVQGRSKGLFSRITFREPVFIGGPGNTTGLSEKLPLEVGLQGCIRHLDINDHTYSFELFPNGEAIKGFDVEHKDCSQVYLLKVKYHNGGRL
ncbi:hypothetical protein RUM44_011615 [Polyplax serrata]|uniref:Laminin G domain-containing protein n=1 Tax=Polyplax serrata TaxID=468196 RepID=A0ABR1AQL9_POLSC